MSDPLLVGITGGIGSGKSTVSRIFSILGVPVYNADLRARQIVNENFDLQEKIRSLLGDGAFRNHVYDRVYVADRVFRSPGLLADLNSLIHPYVSTDFAEWVRQQGMFPYLLKEAALLYESGSYQQLGHIILVLAPLEVRIERILARDVQRDRAEIERIIGNQWPDEKKAGKADTIIRNGPEDLLIPQVLAIHELFSGK